MRETVPLVIPACARIDGRQNEAAKPLGEAAASQQDPSKEGQVVRRNSSTSATCKTCINYKPLSRHHGECYSASAMADAGFDRDRVNVLSSSDACRHHDPRAVFVPPVCTFRAAFRGGEGARD